MTSTASRRGLSILAAAFASAAASVALAGPEDASAADALFKTARKLADAGHYAEACPKFEASLTLFASASSAINLAQCQEHEGRLASAWGYYGRGLALSRDMPAGPRRAALEELAVAGQRRLEPRLPRLRIQVTRPATGFSIQRDGKEVPAGAVGEPLPVDPGQHQVRVSAPGYADATRSITVAEGKVETLVVALDAATVAAPAALTALPPAVEASHREGRAPVWPWITGGLGVVLMGLSVAFLVDDLDAVSTVERNCKVLAGFTTCVGNYNPAVDNARKDRDVPLAIALGVAGTAGAAVSVVFLVKGSSGGQARAVTVAPLFASGGGGLAVHAELW